MNKDAWNILTKEEQSILNLGIIQGKSTWEGGEIMGKSHYKYLEIKARAEHFFKLFTEYFDNFYSLIPVGIDIPLDFRDYINYLIIDRKTLKQTLELIDNKDYQRRKTRDKVISNIILKLKSYNDPITKSFLHLIYEFDRWNNFRILPEKLQEPSAFKRRVKARDLKLIKMNLGVKGFIIDKLKHQFKVSQRLIDGYAITPNLSQQSGYLLLSISSTEPNVMALTSYGFMIFKTEEEAKQMGELIKKYLKLPTKACNDGLTFWPTFRIYIKRAINYRQLYNIQLDRKLLENAFDERKELARFKKSKEEKDNMGFSKDAIFWGDTVK